MSISKENREVNDICNYCGQVLMPGTECDCPGAVQERKKEYQIIRAKQAIDEIFGEKSAKDGYIPVKDENIELMKDTAVLIANHKMYSAAFVLSTGTRAKLTRGSNGVIKVERSETKKNKAEVEE